ncbi:lantibiotic dehydratase family protein [Zobellia sp. B3R18]|uniref:lantibiotic dehydratase family protein n=1 Tax=Zobellia sp. B3R18 TaxID=2841568 RepID=UPI001C076460|nr:lantibiotic dehydratase family protein [Zobellia sp. B3R18]MBU2974969.1 lantibiotic dehydratase family protein [Zobellia sp. B3R18]
MKHFSSNYSVLETFGVRTPLFPYQTIERVYSSKNPEKEIWNTWNNPLFREAIYLASPQFFQIVTSFLKSDKKDEVKSQDLSITLLKYSTRISTRPTPFGLFGGISMGVFANITDLTLDSLNQHTRKSRIDAGYMGMFAKKLSTLKLLEDKLLFYRNTSLYQIGDELRYLETIFVNDKKEYILQRTAATDYLVNLLNYVNQGEKKESIISYLVKKGYNENDAILFIDRLIEEQILISDIEPDSIGDNNAKYLIKKAGFNTDNYEFKFLIKAQQISKQLDSWRNENISLYKNLKKEALAILPETEKTNLVQVDLFPSYNNCTLDRKMKISLSRALNVLYKISTPPKETKLKMFAKAFEERYETQKIPLVKVLDIDSGLSYPVTNKNNVHPYVSDILTNTEEKATKTPIELDEFSLLLMNKLQILNGNHLELMDEDINTLEENNFQIPVTVAAMAELITEDNEQFLFLPEIGGSSASCLLGRFSDGSPEILKFVKEVHDMESSYYDDAIVAEIVHLPEERTGNILQRPRTRSHQINYLSGYNLKANGSIPIEDIDIQIEYGRILLSDRKSGKHIIPFLSNAHNYIQSRLPIYRFLCDMQFDSKAKGIGFSWSNIEKIYHHLPRVTYKDIILSKEQWLFETKLLKKRFKGSMDNEIFDKVKRFQKAEGLPRLVHLKEGDNVMLIDFTVELSIKMFITSLTNNKYTKLIEYTGDKNKLVKNQEGNYYASEFVFAYAKKDISDRN